MKKKNKSTLIVGMFALSAAVAAGISGGLMMNGSVQTHAYSVAKNGGVFYSDYTSKSACIEAGNELNETIANEGMVLLKNDGTLPFKNVKKISVFGKNSVDPGYTGGGSGGAKGSQTPVSIYTALEEAGYETNPALYDFYNSEARSGIARQTLQDIFAGPVDVGETYPSLYDPALKETFNAYNDAALVVITRVGSEGSDNGTSNVVDHDGDTSALKETANPLTTYNELSENEKGLIEMVKKSFKKIVIVVNTPSAMELGDLQADNQISGIIWAGLPGYTGFRSLAGILDGEVNPSGRLSDTFPADLRKDPSFQNFGDGSQNSSDGTTSMYELLDKDGKAVSKSTSTSGGTSPSGRKGPQAAKSGTITNNENMVMYEEGIYVGYHYYETKGLLEGETWYKNAVTYPFGYGLSYTSFAVSIDGATPASGSKLASDGTVSFQVKVENTGKVAGKHVVELYYAAPYIEGGIEKSAKCLGAFAKTSLLEPGESQIVTVSMDVQKMASYDYNDANKNGHKGYELDPGNYSFYISRNAHEVDETRTYALDATAALNFDNDGYTTNAVANRFDAGTTYGSLPDSTNMPGIKFVPMTRAADATTGERMILPSAPTDDERKDTTGYIASRLHHVFNLYELEQDGSTDVRKRTLADIKAAFGDDVTQAATTDGRTLTYKFKDMVGIDKSDAKWNTLLNQLTWDELVNLCVDGSSGTGTNADLGKTGTNDSDGPTGISQVNYPAPVQVAATWNIELGQKQGRLMGDEALWSGTNGWRGPGLNIHRSPFNGRNFEYYSEDGILAGTMAANVIASANAKGFVTYAKHCGVNEQETGRSGIMTFVSEQALREIYFKPFQLACEVGHSNAFMTSMARIGLVEHYSNYAYLQQVIKGEWGFDGVLITDALNGGSPTSTAANMQSFQVSGQDIQMANAPSASAMAVWGAWNTSDLAPEYTVEGATYKLYSAWYWMRVSARNMLYATVNSNLVKNSVDISGFAGADYSQPIGTAVSKDLAANLTNTKASSLRFDVTAGTLPKGLTLSDTGVLSGTLSEKGASSFTVSIYADGWISSSANFIFTVADAMTYTGDDLAAAQVGKAFTGKVASSITTADGYNSIGVQVTEGSTLPAGVTLSEDGTLAGTPTTAGSYTFSLDVVTKKQVTNSSDTTTETTLFPETFTMVVKDAEKVVVNHTVTFDLNYSGSTALTSTVADGSAVKSPVDPVRSGYLFTGWYTDSACTAHADLSAGVSADATYYAGWSKVFDASTDIPKTDTTATDTAIAKSEAEAKSAKALGIAGLCVGGVGIAAAALALFFHFKKH